MTYGYVKTLIISAGVGQIIEIGNAFKKRLLELLKQCIFLWGRGRIEPERPAVVAPRPLRHQP